MWGKGECLTSRGNNICRGKICCRKAPWAFKKLKVDKCVWGMGKGSLVPNENIALAAEEKMIWRRTK